MANRVELIFLILFSLCIQIATKGVMANPVSNETSTLKCLQIEDESVNCPEEEKVARYISDGSSTCRKFLTCPDSAIYSQSNDEQCASVCESEICPELPNDYLHKECDDESNCKAVYSCRKDYNFLHRENTRFCKNGTWTAKPICIRVGIYHNDNLLEKDQPIIKLSSNFTTETIECRVLPHFPANTEIKWMTSGKEVNGNWNGDRTAYQLTIRNTHDFTSKDYECILTVNETDPFPFKANVRIEVNKTNETNYIDPDILNSIVYYNLWAETVLAQCLCKGEPKPSITWYINGKRYTKEEEMTDRFPSSPDFTFSELVIKNVSSELHSGKYFCECTNGKESVKGFEYNINIPSSSRRKRLTRATTTDHTDLCTTIKDQTSTMYTGQVKRYVTSNLLHVKLHKQLLPLQSAKLPKEVIAVHGNDQTSFMKRNKDYIMIFKVKDAQHELVASIPYTKEILEAIKKQCKF